MVDYFGFDMDEDGTSVSDSDFTLSEIATSIIPALIGMVFLGLIVVLILPYRGLLLLSGLPGSPDASADQMIDPRSAPEWSPAHIPGRLPGLKRQTIV